MRRGDSTRGDSTRSEETRFEAPCANENAARETRLTVLRSPAEWNAKFGSTAAPGATARGTVLSVGNFDGLHLGHQKILCRVVERARAANALAGAITFDPHPLKVLRPDLAPRLIQTLPQRLAGFARFGIDAALVLQFDHALAALTAEDFIRGILVEQLRTTAILAGANFRFGHKQAGDVALLEAAGREFGFEVETIDPVVVDGEVVSSSAVRAAVAEGRVGRAARLLGRPFSLTGEIRPGSGRGSSIVFPTLNLAPEQELLPRTGVYATEALVTGRWYRAATNVGFRPTFNGTHLSIESHLFDFAGAITAGPLEVRFWDRLRDEKKFAGAAELREQIGADIANARDFFARLDSAQIAPQPV